LHWLAPESFRASEFSAGGVGAASIPLEESEVGGVVRVSDDHGLSVPFTVRNGILQLYVDHPSTLHIISDERERILSLTLPEIPEIAWLPPASAPHGIPRATLSHSPVDFWKLLAILGGMGLLAEWLFFARQQRPFVSRSRTENRASSEPERQELVTK
jgi:hypothetical protein